MVELLAENIVRHIGSIIMNLDKFVITSLSQVDHLYLAENGSRKFLFVYRFKKEATLRRKTNTYELGIDHPDLHKYYEMSKLYHDIDFYVFFLVENGEQALWCNIKDVKSIGRLWQDETNFPKGIWFIPIDKLKSVDKIYEITHQENPT